MTRTWPDALCELLARRTGVVLDPAQHEHAIERFVSGRLGALNLPAGEAYLRLLSAQPQRAREWSRVVSSLTNPHTYFFRDQEQFQALRSLLIRWRLTAARPLQVWSAGCATGEEPYSIAMLCAGLGVQAQILATDINPEALEVARLAVYQPWTMRHLPEDYVQRFFVREGDSFRLNAEIRGRVRLLQHNLITDSLPPSLAVSGRWDWVLCRNVMLYFGAPAIAAVVRRFAGVMGPHSWLVLSATEHLHGLSVPVETRQIGAGAFAYRTAASPSSSQSPFAAAPILQRACVAEPWSDADADTDTAAAADDDGRDDDGLPLRLTAMLERGELVAARKGLEQLIEAHPERVIPRVTLGNIHLCKHAFERAIETYEEAQKRAPLLPEVHHLQGVVYRKLADLERAAQAFRRALFLQPSFWCASYLLAGVYRRQGKRSRGQRNIQHTYALLNEQRRPRLFASHVKGMPDVDLDRAVVRGLCKRCLAELA